MINNNPGGVSSRGRCCCHAIVHGFRPSPIPLSLSVQALTKIDDRWRLYLDQPVAPLDDLGLFAAELGIGRGGGGDGGDGSESYEDAHKNKKTAWAECNIAAAKVDDEEPTQIMIKVPRFLRISTKGDGGPFADKPGKPSKNLALLKRLGGSDITAP